MWVVYVVFLILVTVNVAVELSLIRKRSLERHQSEVNRKVEKAMNAYKENELLETKKVLQEFYI